MMLYLSINTISTTTKKGKEGSSSSLQLIKPKCEVEKIISNFGTFKQPKCVWGAVVFLTNHKQTAEKCKQIFENRNAFQFTNNGSMYKRSCFCKNWLSHRRLDCANCRILFYVRAMGDFLSMDKLTPFWRHNQILILLSITHILMTSQTNLQQFQKVFLPRK